MLLILVPRTSILLLVRVGHGSIALLSPSNKESFISFAVLPNFGTEAMHVCVLEFTSVCLSKVCKVVYALSLKHSISKVALVVATISPFVPSLAILLAVLKTAFVAGGI